MDPHKATIMAHVHACIIKHQIVMIGRSMYTVMKAGCIHLVTHVELHQGDHTKQREGEESKKLMRRTPMGPKCSTTVCFASHIDHVFGEYVYFYDWIIQRLEL